MQRLRLFLLRPSRYDDDGYVVRHFRGVLPSNTLMCLAELTEDAIRRGTLALDVKLEVLDETVQRIPVKRICRSRSDGTTTVVCLAGVQSNQFPRASDLALQFRRAGVTVMLGGFHVSGLLALVPEIPGDIRALLDAGVTIVKGEVEETWVDLLRDAASGRLRPLYDFLDRRPDISECPPPTMRPSYLRRFVSKNFATMDCGRGCPFACTFCTIVNVQGRLMRSRSARCISEAVRKSFAAGGPCFYFFTDDNFARNPIWEEILDALVGLREQEKIPLRFMMQVDVLSYRIRGFVEKARRAGCSNVFIGMESVNAENLAAVGKRHNHVEDYHRLIEAYREEGIVTHVGYIVGFPFDTPDSLRRDMDVLRNEVKPDHASFFMLTPLPGSQDHVRMLSSGAWLHPDYNVYDSCHPAMAHGRMTASEWQQAFLDAWRSFYSFDNMKAVLRRAPRSSYLDNLGRFLWYRSSIETEGRHPMMCGWLRLKSRSERRPGLPVPSRTAFLRQRVRELARDVLAMARVLGQMEELWLQTRHRTAAEQRIVDEVQRIAAASGGRLRLASVQLAYQRARAQFPALAVPSRLQLLWARTYPLLASGKVLTRADLDLYWRGVKAKLRARSYLAIAPHRLAMSAFRDLQLSILFLRQIGRLDPPLPESP